MTTGKNRKLASMTFLVGALMLSLLAGVAMAQEDGPQAPLCFADYGDLPAPYPTTYGAGGPYHYVECVRLGAAIDAEHNGTPDAAAEGDDNDDTPDDEDGIVIDVDLIQSGAAVLFTADIQTQSSCDMACGELVGWFDWTGDGDWDDPNEGPIPLGTQLATTGVQNFTLNVPADFSWNNLADPDGVNRLYVRFRLYPVACSGVPSGDVRTATGGVTGGEVEDYVWMGDETSAITLSNFSVASGSWAYALLLVPVLLLVAYLLWPRSAALIEV